MKFPIALAIFILLTTGSAKAEDLYVAVDGNDMWTGRLPAPNKTNNDGPFASLERARDEIRKLKADGQFVTGVTVLIRGGNYSLNKPFALTAEDSGLENAQITYRAYQNEQVILTGGKEVIGCKPYIRNIQQCDVGSMNLDKLLPLTNDRVRGYVPAFELFYKSRRMDLARWPNHIRNDARSGEWAYIFSVPEKGSRTRFVFSSDGAKKWMRPEEAQVHIWPGNNWFDQFSNVAKIDTKKSEIILGSPTDYDLEPGRRFYVRNVFEELDAPGEWYINRNTNILYFYPPSPLTKNDISVSFLESLITMNNASNITFRNLTIEMSRGTAIKINGGSRARIAGCVVRNTGQMAVNINGGMLHGVVGNAIYETGYGGIRVSGGNRKSLTPAGHYIDNNHIHHFARLVMNIQPAISADGVGNHIGHNLIHDGPNNGIMLSGNDHVVEFNDFHHLCLESSDCGAIYAGRDWTFRGNVLRYNVIHDMAGYEFDKINNANGNVSYRTPDGARGIVLDDAASGFHIYGNIFYRIGSFMIQVGGGRDNVIENNVFVNGRPSILIDARWESYPWKSTNIKNLSAVPYQSPLWRSRYPKLAAPMRNYKWPEGNQILRNIFASLPPYPTEFAVFRHIFPADANESDRNLVWNGALAVVVDTVLLDKEKRGRLEWSKWKKEGFDIHTMNADPLFVDPSNDNYNLHHNSPAYTLGFTKLPIERIGLYKDEFRTALPKPADIRKINMQKAVETFDFQGRRKMP